ncbi:hypothetical protein JW960_20045 [candidate division KSB1 bacterium]|nr:hypothetical protein [candidate division KSB1 bacterium]
MSVEHLEVIVEEPSMETCLRFLLPQLLGDISFRIYPHRCKDDLLTHLPNRLRGYRQWLPENWRILVIVDRDDDDCRELKQRLESIAQQAGFQTKSASLPIRRIRARASHGEFEMKFCSD